MNTLNYNLIFKPEKQGGFTVIVPSLPGCVTYGKNLSEAKKMAGDAVKAYVMSLIKHNESVPTDEASYVSYINFQLPILNKKIKYA